MFRSSRALQITALLVLSLGAGSLLYLTANYLRRKRREPSSGDSSSYNDRPVRRKRTAIAGGTRVSVTEPSRISVAAPGSLKPEIVHRLHPGSIKSHPGDIDNHIAAVADGRTSEDSAVELGDIADEEEMIDELIRRGVESFEMAVEHWYEAVEYVSARRRQSSSQEEELPLIIDTDTKLHALIGSSRKLRRVIEQYNLAPASLPRTLTPSHMLTWIDDDSLQEQLQLDLNEHLEDDSSDAESFVSASDNAQLEFDDITEEKLVNDSQRLKLFREAVLRTAGDYRHLAFYVAGLQQYIWHGIPCRKMRTLVLGCETDMEFLAKVHCVRQASEVVFSSPDTRQWFVGRGRQAISAVIESAGKDPTDFQAAYDEFVEYTLSPANWNQIKDELTERGVTGLSFYDVLLDFVLLDAFDDLETPPYSVATAVQNRWLSARIKETALTTAIWGVLKAKTSYLQDQYGFMAHFYVVSQYVLPVLAWGFLGPDEELRRVCEYFKEQTLGYIKDLFDFNTSDYSSVSTLCHSIVSLAKERSEVLLRTDYGSQTSLDKTPQVDSTAIATSDELTQC